jgi:hypothetical protein
MTLIGMFVVPWHARMDCRGILYVVIEPVIQTEGLEYRLY